MARIISLIAAVSINGVIGKDNKIPWKIQTDMRRFTHLTKGHTVIMGRKTYDSLPSKFKPLPDRRNIVVTHNRLFEAPGCIIVHTFEDALEQASSGEVFVIGGSQLYAQALPLAHRLCLTYVHTSCEGDAFFPEYNPTAWHLSLQEKRHKSEIDEFDTTYTVYLRNFEGAL
jgi:dihydrofolate reductase